MSQPPASQRRRERRQVVVEEKRRNAEVQARRNTAATWGKIAGAVLVVGALAGYLIWSNFVQEKPGQAVTNQGNQHINPGQPHIAYNTDPPSSGPHYPYVAGWGVHTEPVAKELQVHNLEDGGIVIQYNCPDTCPDLQKQLEDVAKRYPDKVLVGPYPDMDARIALTAWGRIDKFNDFDADRINRFVEAYRGIDHHPPGGGR